MRISDCSSVVCSSDLRDVASPMTEKNNVAADEIVLTPTPTLCAQPRRFSDFATVGEALDYAAQGGRGLNFHDPRGRLMRAYSYRELRDDARLAAYRLIAAGVPPGDRIRSEEHTSELQSLMRISYAVFCFEKTRVTTAKPKIKR